MTTKKAEKQESWCVLRAQAGDTEALDQLLKGLQEPLFRYIQNMVQEPPLAEDILQEVFLRIYRKPGWLREPELFRIWAYRIATFAFKSNVPSRSGRPKPLTKNRDCECRLPC